jgi:DNA-binding transcriptional ArsR family regulator
MSSTTEDSAKADPTARKGRKKAAAQLDASATDAAQAQEASLEDAPPKKKRNSPKTKARGPGKSLGEGPGPGLAPGSAPESMDSTWQTPESVAATMPEEPPSIGSAEVAAFRRTAECLKLISDGTRLAVLNILDTDPKNVMSMCRMFFDISQPALSHHLALLRHGGFVEVKRAGKTNRYALTPLGRKALIAARAFDS